MPGARNITIGRVSPPQLPLGRIPRIHHARVVRRTSSLVAWFALAGAIVPSEAQFLVAGAKFTAGKIGIILLLFPAIFRLCQQGRRALISDFFVCATAMYMIAAASYTGGSKSLFSTSTECLEFLGGYLVARAFYFGPEALQTFIRVLKAIATTAILLGLADSISGRLIVHDIIAGIFHSIPPDAGYRNNMVRAASTFDHEIAFGVFCSLVAIIFLYSEHSVLKRIMWFGLCSIGKSNLIEFGRSDVNCDYIGSIRL